MLKTRMTNRQLSWYSVNRGEVSTHGTVLTGYHYPAGADNDLCPHGLLIRDWGSNKWEEPYIEQPNTRLHQ